MVFAMGIGSLAAKPLQRQAVAELRQHRGVARGHRWAVRARAARGVHLARPVLAGADRHRARRRWADRRGDPAADDAAAEDPQAGRRFRDRRPVRRRLHRCARRWARVPVPAAAAARADQRRVARRHGQRGRRRGRRLVPVPYQRVPHAPRSPVARSPCWRCSPSRSRRATRSSATPATSCTRTRSSTRKPRSTRTSCSPSRRRSCRVPTDMRLFLNGDLQFSSVDEYRYHESLVHPALAGKRDRVLVLGGGDGLAMREVLKYPGCPRGRRGRAGPGRAASRPREPRRRSRSTRTPSRTHACGW